MLQIRSAEPCLKMLPYTPPMQRPVPVPDHGSLTKHMALAWSRQRGTQPR